MRPYYQDEYVTIYNGDCADLIPTVHDFDLVLTDPPYGTELLCGGYGRAQNYGGSGRKIHGDKDLSAMRGMVRAIECRIETGWMVMFCSSKRLLESGECFEKAKYFGELIWDKASPGLGRSIRYSHESALVFSFGLAEKPRDPLISVLRHPVQHAGSEAKHPHEKPVRFWSLCMRFPGSHILDPFAGTGAVGVAAKLSGRKCTMIEIEESYCEIAAKRLSQGVLEL